MLRPRFPRMRPLRDGTLPPDIAVSPVTVLLGRRQFLRALGAVLAALATPWTGTRRAYAVARGRFFTRHERATLEALVDRVIPPDDRDPGARALGAARYIEGLLTAFEHPVPRLFAGGPFSGRAPFPDARTGTASHRRPRNAFRHFIPPSRLEALRWRAEIYGAARARLPAYIDGQRGAPLRGLRDIYREALATIDTVARAVGGGRSRRSRPRSRTPSSRWSTTASSSRPIRRAMT